MPQTAGKAAPWAGGRTERCAYECRVSEYALTREGVCWQMLVICWAMPPRKGLGQRGNARRGWLQYCIQFLGHGSWAETLATIQASWKGRFSMGPIKACPSYDALPVCREVLVCGCQYSLEIDLYLWKRIDGRQKLPSQTLYQAILSVIFVGTNLEMDPRAHFKLGHPQGLNNRLCIHKYVFVAASRQWDP